MYITSGEEKIPASSAIKNNEEDILNAELINSMGHILVIDRNGSEYDVESICVQTGLLRFIVCGLVDVGEITDFSFVLGDDGIKRNVDSLFLDYNLR